jgi:hypothetical protein
MLDLWLGMCIFSWLYNLHSNMVAMLEIAEFVSKG